MTQAASQSEPISAINVTPFIDVLLVLLIMIVLTIPTQTHKLPVTLPQGTTSSTIAKPHELAIDRAGTLMWDGRRIADAQLPALLAPVAADKDAVLRMNPDPEARYDRFDAVLAVVKRANVTRLGFVNQPPVE